MGSESRVPSFGGRREAQKDEFPPVVLPRIVLPPMQLQIQPDIDAQALDGLCQVIERAVYAAAKRGLAAAVAELGGAEPSDDPAGVVPCGPASSA